MLIEVATNNEWRDDCRREDSGSAAADATTVATVGVTIAAADAAMGAGRYLTLAKERYLRAVAQFSADTPLILPGTAYFLPIMYGMTGRSVEKLGDVAGALGEVQAFLRHSPLEGGLAALYAAEIVEALEYLVAGKLGSGGVDTEHPDVRVRPAGGMWLGLPGDAVMRSRGMEIVEESAPGLALITGAAPDAACAAVLARELQAKSLYVFIAGEFARQMAAAGVDMGWNTRLVPLGPDVSAHVHSLGFAVRMALAFGGVAPGDSSGVLEYVRERVPAFMLVLSEGDELQKAIVAGALGFTCPAVANIPFSSLAERAFALRGLRTFVAGVPVPVPYGPAFEGERIRTKDMWVDFGGPESLGVELVVRGAALCDGQVLVIGPDIPHARTGDRCPLGLFVEVSGRGVQADFEPILERQLHHFLNCVQGLMHTGRRDRMRLCVSSTTAAAGLCFEHVGGVIHARIHQKFGRIVDQVRVTVFTQQTGVEGLLERAEAVYRERDERTRGLTDDTVEEFFSCTICQSFAPGHVCVLTPERPGLCGAYGWLDARAAFAVDPSGPSRPVSKGKMIDESKGRWAGVDEFVRRHSGGSVERVSLYGLLYDPPTSSGCAEAITAVLPACNGVMAVDRNYRGPTPSGMTFSMLLALVGGGAQTPGVLGHSLSYLASAKFISGDGGLRRLVWMPLRLREAMRARLEAAAARLGLRDFVDKIATEYVGVEEDAVRRFLAEAGHPALDTEPLL